ncbi:MAG TPA: hypothetical protein VMS40_03825 [Vicinamibacterales bacterium]|nr:hypothetical protein [Vicinamibacterales bacterium]
MTAWDPHKTPHLDAPEYHGPEPPPSEADDTALSEFAEEGSIPPHAWSREKVISALSGFATEKADDETPVALMAPADPVVWDVRWPAIAAGLVACIVIGAAIALRPTSPSPQTSISLPARTVPFVPTALPHVVSEARPMVPVLTVDRSAALSRSNVVTRPIPARAPTIVAEPAPVETRAAIPAPLPSPPAPVAPPASSTAPEPVAPPVRAEAVVSAPEPAAVTLTAIQRDEREIRGLLDAYRDSYDRRDAVSTARLWPGVNTAALTRAFGTLASQQLAFKQCAFDVIGQRATARCSGSLQYVRRVGTSTPQSRAVSWDFEFDRSTGQWLISRVAAQ